LGIYLAIAPVLAAVIALLLRSNQNRLLFLDDVSERFARGMRRVFIWQAVVLAVAAFTAGWVSAAALFWLWIRGSR